MSNPPTSSVQDTTVVRAAIYPGIGVARIGNSTQENGYYIGPEVPDPPLTPTGGTRDSSGAILRQAARFRIYGYNAAGEVVKELGAADADIEWSAHLVNRKAQWYQFQAALDIPEAATMSVPLRNKGVQGDARSALAIDPGPRSISGTNTSGPDYHFDGGTFQGTPVPLGELRTDADGHLLVLGGHGVSASPDGKPVFIPADPDSFNNANGWYDDISDGPVTATVKIDGQEIPVDEAWVVVGPPNYAPNIIGWRTLYDLLVDAYVQCGWMAMPEAVSFTKDILPALQRLTDHQWVNKGFAAMFGHEGPMNFNNPDLLAKLARRPQNPGDPDIYAELRQTVLNTFRPSSNKVDDPRTWPWLYGDAFGSFGAGSPRNNLALSDVRNVLMERWAKGDFVDDYDPNSTPPRAIDDVPLQEQPATLDMAAMHFCLADAFHPGAELTWPMRHTTMYRAPFRIRRRAEGQQEQNYGADLTQQIVLAPGGPLYDQGPGDLTRWMALPWQGDTAFCRSGYDPVYDPFLPSFWPARVPNQVFTDEDYSTVMDTGLPLEQRLAAFNNRPQWLRALTGSAPEQMMEMIAHFGDMGIVEARPGIADDPNFPAIMFVESMPDDRVQHVKTLRATRLAKGMVSAPEEQPSRVEQAGWESPEQLEEFRSIRVRKG